MQLFNVGNTSLVQDAGVKPVEMYIPLWFSDGTTMSTTQSTSAIHFLGDGSSYQNASATNTKLHTLSSNWTASTKFALEATLVGNNPNTANAQLYDLTGSALVTGSSISTTSTTATVIRSAQFTLTAGRQYGVTVWTSNSGFGANICDASLIVFP